MSDLRSVLSVILNALDRDAEDGKAARGEMAEELRAVLAREAGPVVERQEPACYRVRGVSADGSKGEWRLSNIYPLHMSYEAEPLFTSPPAPVAVMLEMSQLLQECVNVVRFGYDLDLPVTTMNRIDACLDKVKELNQ